MCCMNATEAAVAATESAEPGAATPFSLALSDEQKDVRDWVHGFART